MDNVDFIELSKVCYLEKGKTGLMKAKKGKYPLVATGKDRRTCDTYQFDAKAVCVPLVSSTGHGHASLKYIHYQEGKFALGTILVALIPKDENILNAKFLHLYLSRLKDTLLVPLMSGAANVTLTVTKLKKVKIPLLSINKQLKIVSLFNRINNEHVILLNELQTQQTLLKKLRQAILQEAIEGKLTASWREKNPNIESASVLLEKIKAEKEELIKAKKIRKQKPLPAINKDEIPFEIPENWVWCRLGEVCNYGNSQKIEPSKLKGNTWILDLEDIEKESSKLLHKIRANERKTSSSKSKFYKGNVLYSKLRPYLDKVIVADEDGVCTTEILPLHFYGKVNSNYSKYALKRKDFLFYVNNVTKGVKMPRLGTKDGQKALYPLPPLQEQKEIVKKIESLFKLCDKLEEQIKSSKESSEKLMQSVLREAFEVEESLSFKD